MFAAWEASAQVLSHIRQRLEQHDSLCGEHTTPARQQIFADYTRALEVVSARPEALDLATADLQWCVHQLALLCGVHQH